MPGVHDALEDGRLSAEHVDAIANAAASLNDDQRDELAGMQDSLVNDGSKKLVEEFERACRDGPPAHPRAGHHAERARPAEPQGPQVDRQAERHVQALIELDAETNAAMWTAINAAVAAARAAKQNEGLTFDQLQVDALVGLITGARSVDRRVPEVSVLVDLQTLIDGLSEPSPGEAA